MPLRVTTKQTIFLLIYCAITAVGGIIYARWASSGYVEPQSETSLEVREGSELYPDFCDLESVVCPGEAEARITHYGPTGKQMANGEWPYVGAAAISDRTWDVKNRRVVAIVGGRRYDVKDYTAAWIQEKHGLTIDLYSTGTRAELLALGVRHEPVLITYQD